MAIIEVDFNAYHTNLSVSNRIYLLLAPKGGGVQQQYLVGGTLKLTKDATGKLFDADVQKDSKKGLFNAVLIIHTKSTFFLETNSELKKNIEQYFDNNPLEDEILILKTMNGIIYIGKPTNNYSLETKRKKEVLTEQDEKSILKVYETPVNPHLMYFSFLEKQMMPDVLFDLAKKLKEELQNNNKDNNFINKILLRDKNSTMLIDFVLRSKYYTKENGELRDKNKDDDAVILEKFIQDNYEEYFKLIKEAKQNPITFNVLEPLGVKFRLPILDPHAGSGLLIQEAGKIAGMEINFCGLEKKEKKDFHNYKETIEDNPNNNVIYGVNTNSHLGDLTASLKSYTKASQYLPIFLNPPYTKNNHDEKNALEALPHGTKIYGVFPKSMEKYFKENLNGHIFTMPKELSGYTEGQVPQELLFVVGSIHDYNYLEEMQNNAKAQGLFITNTIPINAKNETHFLNSTDIESACTEVYKTIVTNTNEKLYDRGYLKHLYGYHKETANKEEGDSPIIGTLGEKVEATKEILNNSEAMQEAVKEKATGLIKKITVNDLRDEKIFPDTRMYSSRTKLTYREVLSLRGLLQHYKRNQPDIYDIIEKMAIEDGIDLGIKKPIHDSYSLANPTIPDKKKKVATNELGQLKLAFFPTLFTLKEKEDKEKMKELIGYIFKNNNISNNPLFEIENIIDNYADHLTIKIDKSIDEDKSIRNDEVLVLCDKYGTDLCAIRVSLTEFHKGLEVLNMFNIDNYVEQAKLSDHKKSKMFSTFKKYIENLLYSLNQNSSQGNMEKQFTKLLQDIRKVQINPDLNLTEKDTFVSQLYGNFAIENNIVNFFEQYTKLENTQKILEKIVLPHFIFKDVKKNELLEFVTKLNTMFVEKPINFFEANRSKVEDFIKQNFNKFVENNNFSDVEKEEQSDKFIVEIYSSLSSQYGVRKNVLESAIRSVKLGIDYIFIKMNEKKLLDLGQDKEEINTKLYDLFMRNIFLKTFGLRPHQFDNPERYVEIMEDNPLSLILWEMRAGKFMGGVIQQLLASFFYEDDINFVTATKLMPDGLSQLGKLPILFQGLNVIAPASSDISIKDDSMFSTLPQAKAVIPNLPKILNDFFIEKGDAQKEERKRFSFEFEYLIEDIKTYNITLEDIKAKHKDSIFYSLLEKEC